MDVLSPGYQHGTHIINSSSLEGEHITVLHKPLDRIGHSHTAIKEFHPLSGRFWCCLFVHFSISLYEGKVLSVTLSKLGIPSMSFSSFICKEKRKVISDLFHKDGLWVQQRTKITRISGIGHRDGSKEAGQSGPPIAQLTAMNLWVWCLWSSVKTGIMNRKQTTQKITSNCELKQDSSPVVRIPLPEAETEQPTSQDQPRNTSKFWSKWWFYDNSHLRFFWWEFSV